MNLTKYKEQFKMHVPEDDGSAMDWFEETLTEAFEQGRDIGMKADEVLREEGRRLERIRIRDRCAATFHPYCGEPSCYEKLEKILSSNIKYTKHGGHLFKGNNLSCGICGASTEEVHSGKKCKVQS